MDKQEKERRPMVPLLTAVGNTKHSVQCVTRYMSQNIAVTISAHKAGK